MTRLLPIALAASLTAAAAVAQCPYYASGSISAGLSRFNGGEDARLVYVDCLATIGLVDVKFGTSGGSTNLNGLPLVIAVYDDPTDDKNPIDAVLVAQATVPGGVTGGNTGQWQRYDFATLFNGPIPATGGMWVAVGVTYPAGTSPGPGSIEFFNNIAPGTQWLATDSGGVGINYAAIGSSALVDIQTGPGFPPGSWVIRVESGAEYRSFGAGCPGSNGVPTLVGGAVLPQPGLAVVMDASNLAGIVDLAVLGTERLASALDLGLVFGASAVGCTVGVQPLVINTLATTAGTAGIAIGVPTGSALLGTSVFGQIVSLDPTANGVGWTSSNGLQAVLGN
jgi:hypothetical protein